MNHEVRIFCLQHRQNVNISSHRFCLLSGTPDPDSIDKELQFSLKEAFACDYGTIEDDEEEKVSEMERSPSCENNSFIKWL